MIGLSAFREAFLSADLQDTDTFVDFDARRTRYAILWAFYENTVYRDIHKWSRSMRITHALYRYTRNLYNPAYRVGEFYRSHVWGGLLDRDALQEGALPIETDNEALRTPIAQVWEWSNWQVKKDICTLWGSVMGDVYIGVVDYPTREKVYLEILNPGLFEEVTKDPWGNIKGYTIAESRPNPKGTGSDVTYRLVCTRDGDYCIYTTYLNEDVYAWPENTDALGQAVSQWGEPYGFVPMVHVQHNDVGAGYGWAEIHPVRSKIHEVDEQASLMGDLFRKYADPIWLMRGVDAPTDSKVYQTDPDLMTADRPEPGREEIHALWGQDANASAEALIPELGNIQWELQHLDGLLAELERELPELQKDIWATTATSGRALRIARQKVANKVQQRRVNYDGGLVKALQMAIAIGGWRGYAPFRGFNLDSYNAGDLDMSIAQRPVFDQDPMDLSESEQMKWMAVSTAVGTGADLKGVLQTMGLSREEIAILVPAGTEAEPPTGGSNNTEDEDDERSDRE